MLCAPPVRAVLLLCCCGTSVKVRSNSLLARQLTKTAFGFFEFKVVGFFLLFVLFFALATEFVSLASPAR